MTVKAKRGVKMVKDPICGMEIEESKAIKLEKNGETHFFCSRSCQDKFLNKTKDRDVNKKQDSERQ